MSSTPASPLPESRPGLSPDSSPERPLINEVDSPLSTRNDSLLAALRKFLSQSVLARVGFSVAVALLLVALIAPWIAPANPAAQDLPIRLSAPSRAHWMGTDELGRDILSRIIYGARVSLLVAVSVVCGCGSLGLLIGMLAGYAGGWFDRVVNLLLINAFLSFPGILLAIAFAAFFGPGIGKVILALVITGWAGYARLARAQVLKVKELEFVLAAQSLGASHSRILWKHLLPNILQPVLIQATIGMAGAILAESTLSFLGLGVLAPLPSWGAMLNDARGHLFDAPHLVVFPALAVMTAVLAFNLLGDAWRDWLDPRTRSQMAALESSR
jgi:peptide/nickel transport system permease protein